jgi:hypothetical protein
MRWAWIAQRAWACRWTQATPAALSQAKSSEASNEVATQQTAAQFPQSETRSARGMWNSHAGARAQVCAHARLG